MSANPTTPPATPPAIAATLVEPLLLLLSPLPPPGGDPALVWVEVVVLTLREEVGEAGPPPLVVPVLVGSPPGEEVVEPGPPGEEVVESEPPGEEVVESVPSWVVEKYVSVVMAVVDRELFD